MAPGGASFLDAPTGMDTPGAIWFNVVFYLLVDADDPASFRSASAHRFRNSLW